MHRRRIHTTQNHTRVIYFMLDELVGEIIEMRPDIYVHSPSQLFYLKLHTRDFDGLRGGNIYSMSPTREKNVRWCGHSTAARRSTVDIRPGLIKVWEPIQPA